MPSSPPAWLADRTLPLGEGWLDPAGVLHWRDRTHSLRDKEKELLRYLHHAAPRVVPRDELLLEVWGYHPHAASRAVDTTVKRLRAKLDAVGAPPGLLATARGEGYQLVLPAADPVEPPPACLGRDRELERAEAALAAGHPV
ncbi:MAG: helix-turn-helix domain-containing protein, partial [Myxococcota bacterium]